MALATDVLGAGRLVSRRVGKTVYRAFTQAATYQITETQIQEVREWLALTEAAAKDYANDTPQPGSGTYTFDVSVQNEIIGAYKVTRTFENDTVTSEEL